MIREQGDRCIIFELGDRIDNQTGLRCLNLAQCFRQAQLSGVTDVIPSFITVAIQFEPHPDHHNDPRAYFEHAAAALISKALDQSLIDSRIVEIPVCYEGEYGIDLASVAETAQCTASEVIQRHTATLGRVYMVGFAPGQPYIGMLDNGFNIPRRSNPRTAVPAGSVAIANRQTTLYPNMLPGGWHIIGATPIRIFDINRTPPNLLVPGDQVRFVPISSDQFKALQSDGI